MYQDTFNPMSDSYIFMICTCIAALVVVPTGLWLKKQTKELAEQNRLAERKW